MHVIYMSSVLRSSSSTRSSGRHIVSCVHVMAFDGAAYERCRPVLIMHVVYVLLHSETGRALFDVSAMYTHRCGALIVMCHVCATCDV